jgi:uncharacterized membrane protein
LVNDFLASGGRDWPAIPGFVEALERSDSGSTSAAPSSAALPTTAASEASRGSEALPTSQALETGNQPNRSTESDAVQDLGRAESGSAFARFRQDIVGNSLSVFVLLAMVAVVAKVVFASAGPNARTFAAAGGSAARWAIPLLVIVGLFVSAYMSYVETTQTTAVCGPVGDCNTVQQSEYARLFGLIPIGIIGIFGYSTLGLTWALSRHGRGHHQPWLRLLVSVMALVGTLFSIYLTCLEPFVIGATCMWCLTSAVSITLILLLTSGSGTTPRSRVTGGTVRRSREGAPTLTKDE